MSDAVWDAFTTTEGLQSWVAPLAEIDFRVGGKWRANYNAEGELGDPTTIENTILSYDPGRMMSIKATTFPAGFPFMEAAKDVWTVFYFSPMSASKKRIGAIPITEKEPQFQIDAIAGRVYHFGNGNRLTACDLGAGSH